MATITGILKGYRMSLLTDEECKIIHQMSMKPALVIEDANCTHRYYGVDRKSNIEDIKIIERILVKYVPELIDFYNFTGQEPKTIKVRCRRGIFYLPMPNSS